MSEVMFVVLELYLPRQSVYNLKLSCLYFLSPLSAPILSMTGYLTPASDYIFHTINVVIPTGFDASQNTAIEYVGTLCENNTVVDLQESTTETEAYNGSMLQVIFALWELCIYLRVPGTRFIGCDDVTDSHLYLRGGRVQTVTASIIIK